MVKVKYIMTLSCRGCQEKKFEVHIAYVGSKMKKLEAFGECKRTIF